MLEKEYEPKKIEDKIYNFWLEKNFFHSTPNSHKKPFCIVIPPPNVTGVLHMGHGLNNTIQDILIRFKRMQGYQTLWVPGTDHAGIATQNVVEKEIMRIHNKNRYEFGRENLLKEIWKWKDNNGSTIINQLKKLGCSCDWQRERFTMDEGLSNAVKEVFIRLYNKGLIYRGEYIINWCPRCETALSDEEVEHQNFSGFLYYIKYSFKDGGSITVATTRPETMLGDTAVAVHPSDKRYSKFKGKTLILPIVNREILLIYDDFVDIKFGTGAVKVTPAHDINDFEMSKRHNLPRINIFNLDATMNENVPEKYRGMDRFECRKQLLIDLEKDGFLVKKEPYKYSIGHCYRCDTIVEPYLSMQWFVKMKPLSKKAIEVCEKDKIKFFPPRWKKVYLNWMYNIKDWCISRQIWWGHRIPVWYCQDCKKEIVQKETPSNCPFCNSLNLKQDEDVLDTWFSSWLWPFSVFDWPATGSEFNYFYPTNVLVTDAGIIFFWVARMIIAGLEFTGKIPFSEVLIHGTVMDSQGRKMSKSLGNGIDPLEVIEKFGADALRYTIIAITPQGQNTLLSMEKFSIGKHFANKIWNAARFILMNYKSEKLLPVDEVNLELADRWILTGANILIDEVTKSINKFRLNDAVLKIYEFFWHSFCDWYIEITKIRLNKSSPEVLSILFYILDICLKLLHPFMPFLTEEIWQKLPGNSEKSIMVSKWPVQDKSKIYKNDVLKMEKVMEIISAIRNIRGEMNISPNIFINCKIKCPNKKFILEVSEYIKFLAKVEKIEFGKKPSKSVSAVVGDIEIYIPLKGLIDTNKEKERLTMKISEIKQDLEKVRVKLNNKNFLSKAPNEIVEKEKEKEKIFIETIKKLKNIISNL